MTANGWVQIGTFVAILLVLVRPLGGYMTAVFDGRVGFLRPIERGIYALCGADERREQHWLAYGFGMLLFHAAGFLLLSDRYNLVPWITTNALLPSRCWRNIIDVRVT